MQSDANAETRTSSVRKWLHEQNSPEEIRDPATGWTQLHSAVWRNEIETVRSLIEAMADVDATTTNGSTAVHLAVRRGHLQALRLLMAAQADSSLATLSGETPVTEAAALCNSEMVQLLLSELCPVSEMQLNLSLFTAALNCDLSAAVALVQAGADLNFQTAVCFPVGNVGRLQASNNRRERAINSAGNTILQAAVLGGSPSVVSLLVANMTDVDLANDDGISALQNAVLVGNAELVSILLAAQASANAKDSIGWSALSVAAEDGLDNIVAALIASNSSVDRCNNRQLTPLHYASQNGHLTVVKALIKAGANIQCSDSNQSTPLHSAAMSGHAKVVAVLISAGADVNSPDSSGDSPIFMAAQHGYDRIVSLLIENGAYVDMQENAGDSPLQFAANHGHADVVSMLIESGAEIDLRESIGWTALHVVSQQSKAAVAEVLIKAGCQIDIREFDGWTPLHVAMLQGGPTDVVAKLIEAGANVELVDKDGWSPLHFAAAFGQFHLIELFWNPKTCQTAAGSCRQDIEFRDEFTDEATEDRQLSVKLSSAMSDAGFNQAAATLQVGSGAVLQDLIRLRCECRDFFVFGSFADGWGSSLTGIDGRIDDDSDIDITRILAGTKLHIVSSLDSDSNATCPNECTPVRYENGHVEFLINVTRPNQMNEGSPLCPAIDEIRAHPCCNYPPVQVLQPSYRSRMPDVMLEALRGCLQNSECHAVSASPPGMAGSRMRVSTTHLERAVMQRLSTVQGQLFIVLKYLIKKVIAKQATGIKTYHAKNLLFYMLDETPKELWKPENLLLLVRLSLQLLQEGLRTVTQSRSECMRHFFLRDAAVYLRGDHQSKEVISRVVTGVLSDLPDLLAKYKSILRIQASGGVIRFHPFTILISTSDTSSYLDEAIELPCHRIYPIIKRVIAELAKDAADMEAESQNIVENLINRLSDCARTTRECLRALMCLKFGLPLRLDAEVSLQCGSRDIHCPRDQPLSVDEAKVLIWNHLQSTDSAVKFCFKFNEKPVFEFLPCHISEAFPAPTYSYTNYFYVNFDALMKTLQLEFGLSSPSSRAALFEELLNSSEPDTQELQMALNYCQDDELLVRLVHKHRDCIAASRLFDEFLREYKSRIGMLTTCERLAFSALGRSVPMQHLHQLETSESEDSR